MARFSPLHPLHFHAVARFQGQIRIATLLPVTVVVVPKRQQFRQPWRPISPKDMNPQRMAFVQPRLDPYGTRHHAVRPRSTCGQCVRRIFRQSRPALPCQSMNISPQRGGGNPHAVVMRHFGKKSTPLDVCIRNELVGQFDVH